MYKLTIIFGLILILLSGCDKDKVEENNCNYTDFKYYQDKPDRLGEMSGDYILIGSDSMNTDHEIKSFIESLEFIDHGFDFEIQKYIGYKYKQVVLKLSKTKDCAEITRLINEIQGNTLVAYAHYTIQTDDCTNLIEETIGEKCVNSYSSLFYVKVKTPNDLSDLNETILKTNTKIIEQNEFMNDWFSLTADKNSKGDALQMANYFYETGLFAASEPDIIKLIVE